MGYTHCWVLVAGFDRKALEAAIRDMATLIYRSEIPIAGRTGEAGTHPEIEETSIGFNGVEENGHDAFEFDAEEPGWNFCNTWRNPYDTAVAVCLLAAKHHLGDKFQFISNGSWSSEWAKGAWGDSISPKALYERVFPERALDLKECPFGIDEKVSEEGKAITQERWASEFYSGASSLSAQ